MMTYGPRLADYRAEGLKVTGKRLDPSGLVVMSQIIRPQGAAPIPIDWRLNVCDGLYKISDIVVEGVSMAATQRSEFAQMIQRNGGRHSLMRQYGFLSRLPRYIDKGKP